MSLQHNTWEEMSERWLLSFARKIKLFAGKIKLFAGKIGLFVYAEHKDCKREQQTVYLVHTRGLLAPYFPK
jgi:hypothetical protein